MKNYGQEGKTLEFTAPSGGVVSGAGTKIGDTFGVAVTSAAAGDLFRLQVADVVTLPKKAGDTPAQGVKLYWDDTNKYITTTASGMTLVGVHAGSAAAGGTDATVPVRLGVV
jgi:predicted RecA/RadA family phage recombinase